MKSDGDSESVSFVRFDLLARSVTVSSFSFALSLSLSLCFFSSQRENDEERAIVVSEYRIHGIIAYCICVEERSFATDVEDDGD